MKNLIIYKICFILAIFISLILLIASENKSWEHKRHVALFLFGDSFFDVGANNYIKTTSQFRANYYPYGVSFFKDHPTGRFSDGRLICDFITEYAGIPLIPTYLQPGKKEFGHGVNFASGGGGALVGTYEGFALDFKTQVKQFRNVVKILKHKNGDKEAQKIISNAVYFISIGSNDYGWNQTVVSIYSPKEYVSMMMGNITNAIEDLYGKGARKFAFMGMGPIGCVPATRFANGACSSIMNKIARLHNKALPRAFKRLQHELTKFNYTIFDLYTTEGDRIDNPTKYGFDEGKIACCGSGRYRGTYTCGGKRAIKEYELCEDPKKYVIFDSFHPSEKVYEQLSKLIWSGDMTVISPYNLKAFFKH